MNTESKVFCCYCGRWIVYPLKETSEHIVPVSKGGNNTIYNKKRCCHRCNHWRGNHSLERFKTDVLHYLNNNLRRMGYSKQDLETMVENIDYMNTYMKSAGKKLFRPEFLLNNRATDIWTQM